jgi:hypothetical protein
VLSDAAGDDSPSARDFPSSAAAPANRDSVKSEDDALGHHQHQHQHLHPHQLQHHHHHHHHPEADDQTPVADAAVIAAESAYGARYALGPPEYGPGSYYPSASYYGGDNGYMASFLYPHLYTASSLGLEAAVAPVAAAGGTDEYGLASAVSSAGVTTPSAPVVGGNAYGPLEGEDESQTGPIRGAYAARQDHGGHVWRPY